MTKKEKKRLTSWQKKQGEIRGKKLSKARKRSLLLAGIFLVFAVSVAVWQMSIVTFQGIFIGPGP